MTDQDLGRSARIAREQATPSTANLQNPDSSGSDQAILPFEMGYLPPFFQKKAEIELNETPENKEICLGLLKEMMRSDKNFRGQAFDDDFLIPFLRRKKYNVDKAFAKLRRFVVLRTKFGEILFADLSFDSVLKIMTDRVANILPRRCHEGCTIVRLELDNWDPARISVEDIGRAGLIMGAQSLRDPMSQVNGYKAICNGTSNPRRHLRFATLTNIRLFTQRPEECASAKIKEIHVLNATHLLHSPEWLLIKPFLSSKIKKKLIFHSDPETLKKYFSPSVLPVDYGGELEHYDMTEWLRNAMEPEKLVSFCGGRPTIRGYN